MMQVSYYGGTVRQVCCCSMYILKDMRTGLENQITFTVLQISTDTIVQLLATQTS